MFRDADDVKDFNNFDEFSFAHLFRFQQKGYKNRQLFANESA